MEKFWTAIAIVTSMFVGFSIERWVSGKLHMRKLNRFFENKNKKK